MKRQKTKNKKTWHLGGFLNRYEFAYAGRDTVNQAAKASSGVIKSATNDLNAAVIERINQIITGGDKEMERVPPKILREQSRTFIKHHSDY